MRVGSRREGGQERDDRSDRRIGERDDNRPGEKDDSRVGGKVGRWMEWKRRRKEPSYH